MQQLLEELDQKVKPISQKPRHIKLGVYGAPGVGKTYFAATADRIEDSLGRKVLYANAEGGEMAIEDEFPNIHEFKINDFTDLNTLHWYIRQRLDKFHTLIVDTVTEIQKKSMDKILIDNHSKDPKKHDPDVAHLSDWGKNTEQMRKFLRAYRDLPLNVIFIFHDIIDKDETTGRVTISPALTPKLKTDVFGYLDFMMYMYTQEKDGKTVRLGLTQPLPTIYAKSRKESKITRVLHNPQFSDFRNSLPVMQVEE